MAFLFLPHCLSVTQRSWAHLHRQWCQEYFRLRVSLGQLLLLTLVSWVATAGGSTQQGDLDCMQHWNASTTVTSSQCLSSLSILRAPAAQSHDDFSSPDSGDPSMSDPARPMLCKQVLGGDFQVTWFFLTRVLDSRNNCLASQVVWGFLICIFKAFVVRGTIPVSHHFIVAILRIFFKLWFSEWKDALL